jgi:hypothetical protein
MSEDGTLAGIAAAEPGRNIVWTEYDCLKIRPADAALIAAAPNLLSSCEEVVMLINSGAMSQFESEPWVERIRAAITKAHGAE